MLFVDTEEEFDWLAPLDRSATRVTALDGLARGQSYFAQSGVRPVYLVDYPVVDNDRAAAMLGEWAAAGAADVGAHLHPWVNPPHDEDLCGRNSFAGNLPPALERDKLTTLCAHMESRTGVRPIAYRAGRYGIGPNSFDIIRDLGFRLDCSVRSRFDYSGEYGPDFTDMPIHPYWIDADRRLAELPLSTAFVGHARRWGSVMQRRAGAIPHMQGLLSRTGMLARLPLTPEGVSADDCIRAIDGLINDGVRILSFSFHSPTLEPGHTFYVRDASELRAFYRWWDVVLDHLARRSVLPMGLPDFIGLMDNAAAEPSVLPNAMHVR